MKTLEIQPKKWIWPAVVILSLASDASYSAPASYSCTTAREFIATLEFLRDRKEFELPEPAARKIALEASQGCTGAAQRMIRVSLLLGQAGLGGKDSVKRGLEFARRTDQETETFLSVFRRAFAQDGMDLDLRASIQLAEQLTHEFEADTVAVRDDFERLLDYCSTSGKLGLPKPQCGSFAARIAKKGEKWSGGISVPYIQAFEFALSEKGPRVALSKAAEIAEKLVTSGPGAPDNFIAAYRYAVSERGLALAEVAAIDFAMKIGLQNESLSATPGAKAPVAGSR